MRFDRYFDCRSGRFAALYRSERLSRLLGRGPIFDRLRFAVEKIEQVGARRVLDIGCGSGPLFEPLAERGISVTGVEPAAGMLELARAEAARFPELVKIQPIGWESIRAGGDSYDVAVALGVFDYVDQAADLLTVMREAAPHVVASLPGPGLRTELRRFRYGRHGVSVFPYSEDRISQLMGDAGLAIADLVPLGRAGFALMASRSDSMK